jgi:hypothetical protein
VAKPIEITAARPASTSMEFETLDGFPNFSPHRVQNFDSSGFSFPQFEQNTAREPFVIFQ